MVSLTVWVRVEDAASLDEARRTRIASAFLTTNPRLYGRPGDTIYLEADRIPPGRPRDRFGIVTSDSLSADRARRAGHRVAIRHPVDGFDWLLELEGEGRLVPVREASEVDRAAARGFGVVVDRRLAGELAGRINSPRSLGDILDRATEQHGWRTALVDHASGSSLDFHRLRRRSRLVGTGMLARGLRPGDVAAVSGRNLVEWVEVLFGAAYAGMTLVHVNPSLRGGELHHVLSTSGARLLLVEPGEGREAAVAEARGRGLPHLESVVELTGHGYRRLLADGARLPDSALPGSDPASVAAVLFTSGTTGSPKGAMLTHQGVAANAAASAARLGVGPHDRLCLPLPLFHCFGSVVGLLAAFSSGAAVILPGPWFRASSTLEAIRRQRATLLYGVPTMFVALLETVEKRTRPRTLRAGLVGGAPVDASLMVRIASELAMPGIGQVYGLTEASPVVTMTSPDDPESTRFETVGRPLSGVAVRLVDEDRNPVATGSPGALETRSEMLMAGYIGDPEATADAIVDGWLRTGDLATVDEAGQVRIVGRAKEMIIRGGENVYPAEVEAVLTSHPAVRFAAVVGVPSSTFGEEVVAYVEPAGPVTASELLDHCRLHLAPFKVPKEVHLVAELEKTSSGKIIKSGLTAGAERPALPPPPALPLDIDLPLLELTRIPAETSRLPSPPPAAPPALRRSTGWPGVQVGKGWRPKVRVLAPMALTPRPAQVEDQPREGWNRPTRPTWISLHREGESAWSR